MNEAENEKIKDRLDEGETIAMSIRQSRIRPGGANIVTPNTLFVTQKRTIIRNPIQLGIGEHIEEYLSSNYQHLIRERDAFC